MPSLLLDEKICFIRLPLDTLQNFWQVITLACGVSISAVLVMFATFLWFINGGRSWPEFFLPFYRQQFVSTTTSCYHMLRRNNLSFYFSLYFEGSPQAEDPKGFMQWGKILLYFYVPMERFLMEWIRKIQNHEERDRSGKFKKTRRKEKKRLLRTGGSHTHVFSLH